MLRDPVTYFSVTRRIVLSLLVCFSSTSILNAMPTQEKQADPPILKAALLKQLRKRPQGFTAAGLIERIELRKVAFRITPEDEREIRTAGNYLQKEELDKLIAAVRNNFGPSLGAPLRAKYILLDGYALDLFVRREINQRMDEEAGGALVVRNSVFRTLAYLVYNFSERRDPSELESFYVPSSEVSDEKLARRYNRRGRGLFVGSRDEEPVASGIYVDQYSKNIINSLNDPSRQWRARWNRSAIREGTTIGKSKSQVIDTSLLFHKFADRRDLEVFKNTVPGDFYLFLTRKYMPPDLGIIDLAIEQVEDESAEDYGCEAHRRAPFPKSTYASVTNFHGPFISLRVAIIENISGGLVRLGKFIVRENISDRLRRRDEDRTALSVQGPQRQDLYLGRILRPGEKLAVPLEMLVSHGNEKSESDDSGAAESPEPSPSIPDEALEKLRQSGGMVFPLLGETGKVTGKISIKPDVIDTIVKRPEIDLTSMNTYVYGTSMDIDAIEVDRQDYEVSRSDPRNFSVIIGLLEAGSCPYVYTYSRRQSSWLNQGVILDGVNEKAKEKIDEKVLREFDGRVLIKEKDPENSYIDSMFVRAISADGVEINLYPRNKKLRYTDGDYLKLRQGEEIMVSFDLPKNFLANRYILVSKGFYVPYRHLPAVSRP